MRWLRFAGAVPDDAEHGIQERVADADKKAMPPTLLIVDDHGAFRATARALLECDGWDVIGEAGDGTSGILAARELKPDVVLLDVRLPDIDGFTVAERLTAGGNGPAVVVTSSSDDPLYAEQARRNGARGFIPKHDLSGEALQRLVG